jgi:hypothetical protein
MVHWTAVASLGKNVNSTCKYMRASVSLIKIPPPKIAEGLKFLTDPRDEIESL